MKRITDNANKYILFLVAGVINSNFSKNLGAVGNLAIFNKEYESAEAIRNLEVKEKSTIKGDKTKQDQQSDTISESKAISLVKDMFKNYGYMPSIIEVDHIEGNNYVVHAYEIIQDDEKTWHTATAGWYYVDMHTGKIESIF